MNYSARTEASGSTRSLRCRAFRERKLGSDLRGTATAGGGRVSANDSEAGFGSGDEYSRTYRQVGSSGGRRVHNLRKRFAGGAQTAFGGLQLCAQRSAGAVAAVGEVAELVQQRAVLRKQQRQRQNPRETQSTHIHD